MHARINGQWKPIFGAPREITRGKHRGLLQVRIRVVSVKSDGSWCWAYRKYRVRSKDLTIRPSEKTTPDDLLRGAGSRPISNSELMREVNNTINLIGK